MPITYELEPESRLAIFRHVGEVSDDELLTFYRDFFDAPRASDYVRLLIHLEQTKSIGRSTGALRALAEIFQERLGDRPAGTKVAVVAPSDHSFGMARMYEAMTSRLPWDFHVFRDGASARVWLGIEGGADDA